MKPEYSSIKEKNVLRLIAVKYEGDDYNEAHTFP